MDELKPQEVTDVDMAFPAQVRHLMPAMEDIPRQFGGLAPPTDVDAKPWLQLQHDWFFRGLGAPEFYAAEGISAEQAYRHLHCIQRSFEPQHEHKEASVAYLASRWFNRVKYRAGKTDEVVLCE